MTLADHLRTQILAALESVSTWLQNALAALGGAGSDPRGAALEAANTPGLVDAFAGWVRSA